MAQYGETRDDTFHGEIDGRCRAGLRHAVVVVVCSNVTGRTKGGSKAPKQACRCVLIFL